MCFVFKLPIYTVIAIALCLAPLRAQAADIPCPKSYAEIAKNHARQLENMEINGFAVSRPLGEYLRVFDAGLSIDNFSRRLWALGRDDHWIDMGAGQAIAMLERQGATRTTPDGPITAPVRWLGRSDGRPRMTAVGYSLDFESWGTGARVQQTQVVRNRISTADPNDFRYLHGRLIEDYPNPRLEIGTANLITDFYGPLAYTRDLSEVLRRYIDLLREGGAAFSYGTFLRTEILDESGKQVPTQEFLASVRGIQSRPGASRAAGTGNWAMVRTQEEVYVPNLEPISFSSDIPPYRVYRWNRNVQPANAAAPH